MSGLSFSELIYELSFIFVLFCFYNKKFQLFIHSTSVHLGPTQCHALNKYRRYKKNVMVMVPDFLAFSFQWQGRNYRLCLVL